MVAIKQQQQQYELFIHISGLSLFCCLSHAFHIFVFFFLFLLAAATLIDGKMLVIILHVDEFRVIPKDELTKLIHDALDCFFLGPNSVLFNLVFSGTANLDAPPILTVSQLRRCDITLSGV